MGIKVVRRSKNIKNEKFAITEVSLKNLSKLIEEFKDVTYESYVKKIPKHIITESYFYLS